MTRFLGGLVVGAVAALALGYQLWRVAPVVETPLPEVRQADSSLVLERKPDANAKPAHQLPRGSTLERTAQLTIAPTPTVDSAGNCACEDVTVDLSLVRQPDETRRVVASVEGGTLVGGVDVPVETPARSRPLRWTIGATRDMMSGRWGGYVARDFDSLLLLRIPYQAQVMHIPGPQGGLVAVGVAIRF